MADVKLVFDLLANDKASPVLANVAKSASGFGSSLANVGKIAAGVVAGGALTQLPGMMLDFAKAAVEDEQSTVRVSQVLKSLPGDYAANTAAVNDAIAAGQRKAFSDDEVRDSFTKLAVATGDSEEAIKRQGIAMDLARGANIPLADASKLLGKVTDDNLQVFKRMGITLTDVSSEADVLAAVQAKFAGQADAYADSTAGQFEQAQLALSETGETLGYVLLPAITAVAKATAQYLPIVQELVSNNQAVQIGLAAIATVLGIAAAGWVAGTTAMVANLAITTAVSAATAAYTAVQWLLNAALAANPIGLVVLGLAALAAALVFAYNNSEDFRRVVDAAFEAVAATAEVVFTFLSTALADLQALWAVAWPAMGEMLATTWDTMGNVVSTVMGAISAGIETTLTLITALWNGDWTEVGRILATTWDDMQAVVDRVFAAMGTAISTGLDALKRGWSDAWSAIGTTTTDAWTAITSATGTALSDLDRAVSSGMGTVRATWDSVWTAISGSIGGVWEGIVGTIKSSIAGIADAISGLVHAIQSIPAPRLAPMPDTGFRAAGGPVSAGGAYIVGERGPEMFVPRNSGSIVPNGVGAGPVINGDIVLTLDRQTIARVTREELLALGRRNGNAFGTLGVSTP